MKTKRYLAFLLLLMCGWELLAQEDKNPVAETDYADAMALQTIEIPVLENDYAWDDHPFEIFLVTGGNYGEVDHTDSTIIYTAGLNFSGTDSVMYNIKDLENNLISEFAKVYIEISNYGYDFLDINNVRCRINSYGLQYWDLGEGSGGGYEVLKGSGKKTVFSESSWIGGISESGDLHLAAERYRQVGVDFFQGPVMDSVFYSDEQDIAWNRVWKLTSAEIEYHRQHWQDEGYLPISNIMEWPGNGNTELGQAEKLAPYYDWNQNGLYDPENGDFPLIKGDMAIYVIVNDHRGLHTESGGKRLGVEIHSMYYAYDRPGDSALAYTTFCDRKFINRSGQNYSEVYVGRFLDFDIGFFLDDYVCCDTSLQCAMVYNADEEDGQGEPSSYGLHPPAQAFTCLGHKLDGFTYFFSYGQPDAMLDPQMDHEYYNYLSGRWRDSTLFTYGGNGYGGNEPVKHIFTGDPVSGTGWTEADSPSGPGDRRGLMISGPFDFNAGDSLTFTDALVFARDYSGDNLSSVSRVKSRVQEVRDFYQQSLAVDDIQLPKPGVRIFPNPCKDFIRVEVVDEDNTKNLQFSVIDLMGKCLKTGVLSEFTGSKIDMDNLQSGIYFITVTSNAGMVTKKIIVN